MKEKRMHVTLCATKLRTTLLLARTEPAARRAADQRPPPVLVAPSREGQPILPGLFERDAVLLKAGLFRIGGGWSVRMHGYI